MAAGLDQAFFSPSKTAWNTSGPPIRSNRNSSHIMFVHRDCPPSENGAMPLALNLGTRSMMSPQVCGGLHADLVEDLLVVVEDDRLHGLGRHRVDLAVDRRGAESGREQPVLDRRVLVEPRGEVLDLAGLT